MNMSKYFEKIANRLQPVLPAEWNRVCLYAEITEKSYEIFYYCFVNGVNNPVQCYQLTEDYQIEEEEIDEAFEEIYTILKPIWMISGESGKDKWTNYTLIFESTGRFEEHFDYTNLDEGSYEYKQQWKEKYLITSV